MNVDEILRNRMHIPVVQQHVASTAPDIANAKPQVSFAETLMGFVGDVQQLNEESSTLTKQMIQGEQVDLHDVMIASEKAKTSMNLLLELRNKGLDLYRELIRTPV
jgi:flagellar hook-basal body complex protein FliE